MRRRSGIWRVRVWILPREIRGTSVSLKPDGGRMLLCSEPFYEWKVSGGISLKLLLFSRMTRWVKFNFANLPENRVCWNTLWPSALDWLEHECYKPSCFIDLKSVVEGFNYYISGSEYGCRRKSAGQVSEGMWSTWSAPPLLWEKKLAQPLWKSSWAVSCKPYTYHMIMQKHCGVYPRGINAHVQIYVHEYSQQPYSLSS